MVQGRRFLNGIWKWVTSWRAVRKDTVLGVEGGVLLALGRL